MLTRTNFFSQAMSIIESLGSGGFILLLICALAIAVVDFWVRMPFQWTGATSKACRVRGLLIDMLRDHNRTATIY